MLEDRDQVLPENCELKVDEATRSSQTRTFIAGKKKRLFMLLYTVFTKTSSFCFPPPTCALSPVKIAIKVF